MAAASATSLSTFGGAIHTIHINRPLKHSSPLLGTNLNTSPISRFSKSWRQFKVAAEYDEKKQTDKDRWKGLVSDMSDDQQDITRGKGMVDSLFQAPMGTGTHHPIMSSYDYISKGLRVPLILGIWGGKGQVSPIMMSAGELESGNAGEPGKMCCLFINDLDAGAGRMGVIVTGNDFSTLYAPLIRDGRMDDIVRLVDTFPGQSIDFFGALRARVYDDEVRKWLNGIGVENVGRRLVNSKEGPPTFEQPKMTVAKLLEYGKMLVKEQENVKRVQLADKYLKEAALGDANQDSITNGSFYGKAAQQVNLPLPEGCTDPSARNFDPTARSDDGSCVYQF
ncbi:Ribulose bisphosphate carboxylase/oxygenase activase, chloroplastic [Linum perenne]